MGSDRHEPSWQEYVVSVLGGICFVGQIALCIVAYNSLNLDRILYLGWTILAIALLIGTWPRQDFGRIVRTIEGQSIFEEGALVDSGMSGVVRHPIYLSFSMVLLALILISQHWLSAVLGLPWILYLYLSMLGEEHIKLQQYGDAYRSYMRAVPRINVAAGLVHYQRLRRRATEEQTN